MTSFSSHEFWGDMSQPITLFLQHFLPQRVESYHLAIAIARNLGLYWIPLLPSPPHPIGQQVCYFHSASLRTVPFSCQWSSFLPWIMTTLFYLARLLPCASHTVDRAIFPKHNTEHSTTCFKASQYSGLSE